METENQRKVYLDYAATTYVNGEVIAEMAPLFSGCYGNSSSLHSFGRDASAVVENAREKIANAINCEPSEIYFTSYYVITFIFVCFCNTKYCPIICLCSTRCEIYFVWFAIYCRRNSFSCTFNNCTCISTKRVQRT